MKSYKRARNQPSPFSSPCHHATAITAPAPDLPADGPLRHATTASTERFARRQAPIPGSRRRAGWPARHTRSRSGGTGSAPRPPGRGARGTPRSPRAAELARASRQPTRASECDGAPGSPASACPGRRSRPRHSGAGERLGHVADEALGPSTPDVGPSHENDVESSLGTGSEGAPRLLQQAAGPVPLDGSPDTTTAHERDPHLLLTGHHVQYHPP